ncbi:MAG: hypothetical protein ACT4TC_05630 [Myxococcaceae bacterium]
MGDGVDGRVISVGFSPDGVMLFPSAAQTSTIRLSPMPGNVSYTLGRGSSPTRSPL